MLFRAIPRYMVNSTAQPEPLLHTVNDVLASLGGMSRATFYRLVNDGTITVVKIGSRTYVKDEELRRYVASLTAAAS
jgi:excisionase family DNA binding protein